VLLGLGGWLVIQGQLTLGQLVAAELIVAIIVGSLAKLGKHLESFYDLQASVDKLFHLLELPTEREDGILHLWQEGPACLKCREVSYSHHLTGRGISDFNLEAHPGDKVAVFGVGSSGKSTLADLIFGLRGPTAGYIEIDGISPRDFRPDVLRQHVALVRGVEIFSGTVLENIHLHRTGIPASEIHQQLHRMGLQEELAQLPEGLDTQIASGGGLLTHSQAIRLMLVRAMVARPRLLVIDGTLDALPERDRTRTLDALTAEDAPWTLILLTGNEHVRDASGRTVNLASPLHEAELAPSLHSS
jgi:ABC-type bacteriocin/lantibiotic exporter with double-glycine peptidase domain